MKIAPKIVFLLKDSEGFASAISEALCPNPPFSVSTLDENFDFSLEHYGIKDHRASGSVVHYLDDNGIYQVSVLILESYEPPILACAVNEVLSHITGERLRSSSVPALVVPFVVSSLKLKLETRSFTKNSPGASLYGVEIGPETDITRTMVAEVQKLPSTSQIHHEQLACLFHLLRILNLPAFVAVGQMGHSLSNKTVGEEIQMLNEMGEFLANSLPLSFSRERMVWNPKETSKDVKEPWRALYG